MPTRRTAPAEESWPSSASTPACGSRRPSSTATSCISPGTRRPTRTDGVYEQTREILSQIDAHLAAAGSDKSKLLSASIWLPDIDTFGEMNRAWDEWVDPDNKPARATVEARLASPDYKVEIAAIAAR